MTGATTADYELQAIACQTTSDWEGIVLLQRNATTPSANETSLLSSLERCEICGESIDETHACLQGVPASVLRLEDPRLGSVVVDHYILEEFVSESQRSLIYKARHQLSNTHVAVKISTTASERDPFSLIRTSRAALIAVRLDHPNIVRNIEFNYDPGQHAVLVMEWANGTPLSQIIATEISLTPYRALNLLEGLCDALRYAQTQGVNHINLKPSGILVDRVNGEEQAKLLDFGLMKMLGPHTQETMNGGEHFKYASPEERIGQPPDQRSIIYSLGLILYDMLTCRVEALDASTAAAKIDLPSLMKTRPELDEAPILDKILNKCLAFKPSRRFQTVEELAFAVTQAKTEIERIERIERLKSSQFETQASLMAAIWMTLFLVACCAAVYLSASGI